MASTGPTPGTRRLPRIAGRLPAAAKPMAPPTVAPMALPMPGCSAAWVGSCASSAGVASAVRILILSFAMPSGTSSAAARWAAERALKTPTTGFMIGLFSGSMLLEHWALLRTIRYLLERRGRWADLRAGTVGRYASREDCVNLKSESGGDWSKAWLGQVADEYQKRFGIDFSIGPVPFERTQELVRSVVPFISLSPSCFC